MRYFILLLLVSNITLAQKISIEGVVKDSSSNPLPSATILLLSPADSTLINFSSSNSDGSFKFSNVVMQPYLLKITYVGHNPITKLIAPGGNQTSVFLGDLILHETSTQLSEITIKGEVPPVTIKKDTIEFNAGSFKTKENAMVEDLLKKLPGVEVDNDGTIRAQGEQVRKVTVDGKNFFGNDPKIATRNLPADAIAKVQVYDRKSDQTAFTGIDDGQREKTINLELKEEKRKGAFGNIMAGIGNDDRYQAKANINKFQKTRQISLLGMANNVNEQGFGIDEYMNFTGGSQQMMSGRGGAVRLEFNGNNQNGVPMNFGNRNSGIIGNYAGGVNFNNQLNKNTDINSSYFYSRLNHDLTSSLTRLTTLPSERTNEFTQNSESNNVNDNHRLNTVVDHKIDTLNSLKWTTNMGFNETELNEQSNAKLKSDNDRIINAADRSTRTLGNSLSLTSNLLWRHRFAKRGRTLSSNLQFGYSENERNGIQYSTVFTDQETVLSQTSEQTIENTTYGGTITYTEPLGNRKYLEANYSFRENINDFARYVFDQGDNIAEVIPELTNRFQSRYQYQREGINFRVNRSKYNFTLGASLQQTILKGELLSLDQNISKAYHNVLPVIRFNYDFTSAKRVNVDFETSVQEPSIQQLQPVVDNTDPLNLYTGNPSLRPSYTQNARFNYSAFNPVSFISFFTFMEAALINNAITLAQTFDDSGVRTTQPINVKENRRLMGDASFGFPIKKFGSRINVGGNISHQSGHTLINEAENNTTQNVIGGRIRYEYQYKDFVDVSLSANLSRQAARYELAPRQNQLFYNNAFGGEVNFNGVKNFVFSSSLEYLMFRNRSTNLEQSIPLLNFSVSRFLLKGKSGELKAAVVNVLDQDIGISQTSGLNYFETQRVNNLGRYIMVSFTYSLNKQLNPMGFRKGGMMRIIR